MSTHTNPYNYSKLKPNAKRSGLVASRDVYTRLICVLPSSSHSDQIHCLIKPINLADLESEPEDEGKTWGYDAVSYVWGEPVFTRPLYCDNPNSHLMITERLYNILHHLRAKQRQQQHLRLWIDAICIDQGNPVERSRQVQFMTHIYRQASRTHVFLGGGGGHWLQSEWFTRRWVIQEFLVSPVIIIHHGFNSTNGYHEPTQRIQTLTWEDLIHKITAQQQAKADPKMLKMVLHLAKLRRQGITSSGILKLLSRFHNANCGDERDRLFSLIGIANNVSLRDINGEIRTGTRMDGHHNGIIDFAADYRMHVEEVYTAFARASLSTMAPFGILHCAGAFRAKPEHTLPSWVPDWSQRPLYRPFSKGTEFKAGLDLEGKTRQVSVSGNTVTIAGRRLTAVKDIPERQDEFFSQNLAQYFSKDLDILLDRICIRTEDGDCGLGPPGILPGDDVVIFYGAGVPFILRSVVEKEGLFRLVGECWIEGVMYTDEPQRYSHLEDRSFVIE